MIFFMKYLYVGQDIQEVVFIIVMIVWLRRVNDLTPGTKEEFFLIFWLDEGWLLTTRISNADFLWSGGIGKGKVWHKIVGRGRLVLLFIHIFKPFFMNNHDQQLNNRKILFYKVTIYPLKNLEFTFLTTAKM